MMIFRLRKDWFLTAIVFAALVLSGCDSENTFQLHVPPSFDSLPAIPENNELTTRRIELGRLLFHDKRLSGDGRISCASCHKAELAYADTVALSLGVHGNTDARNAYSLINVAYQNHLFMEGGISSLELQVVSPFSNQNEMGFTLKEAVADLKSDSAYTRLANLAYGRELDEHMIGLAIASFERSLISTGSRFDDFLAGDSTALNASELRGKDLFYSDKTGCASCHSGFLFTDQKYWNIGLYENYSDEGRARLTQKAGDLGKFKTPSLRNVAITYPYMHNGSLKTLMDVLIHFNEGGKNHINQDERIKPLGLSADELKDLESFLGVLTEKELDRL
ncbi:MAG: cytochrome-c peroxidase [Flavobacteriales bacterium]|nr:cytochrome-c peroxidase [Flavobacteriales bacterium]